MQLHNWVEGPHTVEAMCPCREKGEAQRKSGEDSKYGVGPRGPCVLETAPGSTSFLAPPPSRWPAPFFLLWLDLHPHVAAERQAGLKHQCGRWWVLWGDPIMEPRRQRYCSPLGVCVGCWSMAQRQQDSELWSPGFDPHTQGSGRECSYSYALLSLQALQEWRKKSLKNQPLQGLERKCSGQGHG